MVYPPDDEEFPCGRTAPHLGDALTLRQGRVYSTGYHLLNGKLVTNFQLQRRTYKRGAARWSCYDYPMLLVAEYWGDAGDDGHTKYELYGHVALLHTELWNPDDKRPTYKKIIELTRERS